MSKKPKTELEVLLKAIAEGGNVDGITPNNDLNYWLKKIVENIGGGTPTVISINTITKNELCKVVTDKDGDDVAVVDLTKNGEYIFDNIAGDTLGDLGIEGIYLNFGFIKGYEGSKYYAKPIVETNRNPISFDIGATLSEDEGQTVSLGNSTLEELTVNALFIKVTNNCVYIGSAFEV